MTLHRVISKDGTPIVCRRTGSGPPLVLIHGTGGYATRWTAVLTDLEQVFTVYAMDRRGRGESGDNPAYSIAREFEDVIAVVESTNEPANVLGHSFGGVCAIEAALGTRHIRKLILYEPPLPGHTPLVADAIIDALDTLVAAGDREGILRTFMLEVIRMPPADFDEWCKTDAWRHRLATAHTLPRELRALDTYRLDVERVRKLATPTLLFVGEKSPASFKEPTDFLAASLPDSRTVVLGGQHHIAMDTAPALFTQEVKAFLLEKSK